MPTSLTVIPSASRLMESLRDIGYELPAALADLVDNSIDASATEVSIECRFNFGHPWISVSDNGCGMTAHQIDEAMRFGTHRMYRKTDLGKFGLGLKTASLSQGRRLTVASRSHIVSSQIEIRRWDMDRVIESDEWQIEVVGPKEMPSSLLLPLKKHQGTIVLIEKLDRVNKYKVHNGPAAETGFYSRCRDVEEYLAMVFHRFLSGEAERAQPLVIRINENEIKGWDPFARTEAATKELAGRAIDLHFGEELYPIKVQPYVLPSQAKFSNQRAWQSASGPKKWNHQQGFYFYREDRMIQSGGWNRLRTSDEHTKLARISVDIPPSTDAAFEINVSKMRVMIPDELKEPLRIIAGQTARVAQEAYRQKGESLSQLSYPLPAPRPTRQVSSPLPLRLTATGNDNDSKTVNNRDEDVMLSFASVKRVIEAELNSCPDVRDRLLYALQAALAR